MAKLEEMIETESCFYSVRSDNSMLLALKVRETFTHRSWILIRTDTQRRAQSETWPLTKIGDKESALFPALSLEELKKSAHEGDFLEWLPGCAAPAQSETEILLNERERLLEERIAEASTTLIEQAHGIEARIERFLSELDTRQQGVKSEAEILLNEREKLLEERIAETLATLSEQGRGIEARIQNFLSELPGMTSKQVATAEALLQEAQQEGERIKGEVKYFQVTLEEKRKESLATFEQRRDQANDGIDRAQRSLDEKWEEAMATLNKQMQQAQSLFSTLQSELITKEQTLASLAATQTKAIEEKVQAIQQELAEQQPLSEEKHRQDVSRKTFWISFWFVAAGIIFFAITLLTAFLPFASANTLLIEIFGSVATLLTVILAGVTFLVRRNVKPS